MKRLKLYLCNSCLIPIMSLTLSGCGIKPPPNYFKNENKVGIIYIINPILVCEENLLYDEEGYCGNPYGEYSEPLKVVDNKIRSMIEIQIKDNYKNLFKEKGKSFIEIDREQYLLYCGRLPEFNKAFSSEKPYYQLDLRPLKSQYFKDYEIDELLFVEVYYGLDYEFFFVDKRRGYCTINSEIVDLNDNSIVFRSWTEVGGGLWSNTKSYSRIKGRWKTPPEYENLSNAIKSAISNTLGKQRKKLIRFIS